MTIIVLFDLILIGILLVTAWKALTMPDLFNAVIVFIAFGLLVSLAWVRLQAPDVAMAEAAVGSGITGALLLSSLSAIRRTRTETLVEQKKKEGE
jgi:energy-converting hydrogenase B subunit D